MYGVTQGQYTQTRQAIRSIFGNESQNIDPIVLLDVEELKHEKIFAVAGARFTKLLRTEN
jgi:hypothetical protein